MTFSLLFAAAAAVHHSFWGSKRVGLSSSTGRLDTCNSSDFTASHQSVDFIRTLVCVDWLQVTKSLHTNETRGQLIWVPVQRIRIISVHTRKNRFFWLWMYSFLSEATGLKMRNKICVFVVLWLWTVDSVTNNTHILHQANSFRQYDYIQIQKHHVFTCSNWQTTSSNAGIL